MKIKLIALALLALGCVKAKQQPPLKFNIMAPIANTIRYLEPAFDAATVDSDIVYLTAFNPDSGKNLNLEVHHWYPTGDTQDRWTFLYQHGGGWTSGLPHQHSTLGDKMAMNGYNFLSFDYRLTGADDGFVYGTGDFFSAISWAKKNATTFKIDTNRIILTGESAGAYDALHALYHPALDSQATLLAGASQVHDIDFAIPISGAMIVNQAPDFWNHTSFIDRDEAKSFLMNIELDTIVPKAWVDTTHDEGRKQVQMQRYVLQGKPGHIIAAYPPAVGTDGSRYVAMFLSNLAYRHFNPDQAKRLRFPSRGILDDFNRANQGPPPSSAWLTLASTGNKVLNNEFTSGGAGAGISIYNTSFDPGKDGMEVYVTVSNKGPDDNRRFYLMPWSNGQTSGGLFDAYEVQFVVKNGAIDQVQFKRFDNGIRTQLGATLFMEFEVGDRIGAVFDDDNDRIIAYLQPQQFQYAFVIGTRIDATYGGAGKLALGTNNAFMSLDDFGGGEVRLKRAL